ncbi:hypothetical protein LX73_2301 [Fodinibius salinus]|uniref:Uncharacterized protein n=1 Tax=Fodinibius salinus TaxID=860790 RepID=A0A5D3YFQ7_9BACT|nr:hypothetical protein [Fodinibius salinus]TYP92055.1 hypothetical protein LX73_2301 [Fodinibius salinus]
MNKPEYDQIQRLLLLEAQSITTLFDNLDEFITDIDRAEITGPLLDSKLYRQGQKKDGSD